MLRQHRARQIEKRTRRRAAGKPWQDSGYVFVRMDGLPIHPSNVSCRFRQLLSRVDIPPIRLHDLRHTAASIAHQAGADLKTLQDLLGHSSILVTADTYTSVLPVAQRRCANATASLIGRGCGIPVHRWHWRCRSPAETGQTRHRRWRERDRRPALEPAGHAL
jgi:integrase